MIEGIGPFWLRLFVTNMFEKLKGRARDEVHPKVSASSTILLDRNMGVPRDHVPPLEDLLLALDHSALSRAILYLGGYHLLNFSFTRMLPAMPI